MKLLSYLLMFVTLPFLASCTLQDQWNKEVTVYPVLKAKGGGPIPLNRTVYKIFPETQLVIYWHPEFDEPPRKLAKCVVRDRLNWTCEYQDGSGRLTMIDGRFSVTPFEGDTEYVSWWKWQMLGIIRMTK